MDLLVQGFQFLMSEPSAWFLMVGGMFMGIIFGSIPGLTATLGVTLMIPFTFAMQPVQGLVLLIGIYVGGISGGLITATLINIPGTPASLVTCWDGYPMAKNGAPDKALSVGVFSSLIGGVISAVALIFIAPQLAKIALKMGTWEYFSIAILGLSIVVSMTSKDFIKGLLSMVIGLILGTVGIDSVTGITRLTFDAWQLQAGISSTALMMSLFAIREMFVQMSDMDKERQKLRVKHVSIKPPVKEIKGCGKTFLVSSVIGTFIGILPGVAQSAASILAYNQAKNLSKTPEKFGTGCVEGVVASETANNAVNGGAIIPLLTLGIPGDMTTAALIGGLMIHGIQPGPMLFDNNAELVGSIFAVYLVANFVMYFMELGLMQAFIRLVEVPMAYLFPAILISCILGTLTMNNRIFDLWVLILFGIGGYMLSYLGFAMTPLILGFILGPMIEKNFRTSIIAAGGNVFSVLHRPVAMLLLVMAVAFIVWPIVLKRLAAKKQAN